MALYEKLSLRITILIVALVAALWIFSSIAEGVVNRESLVNLDIQVSDWVHARVTPGMTRVMVCITVLGSGVTVGLATIGLALLMISRRYWNWLLALIIAVPGGVLLNAYLKHEFQRSRPQFKDPILFLTTYGFPSGHTMAATVLYGLLAAFAVWSLADRRWRVLALITAALLIVLVATSRVYLGAHYLSDVVAAVVEGLLWLALSLIAVDITERRRAPLSGSAGQVEINKSDFVN